MAAGKPLVSIGVPVYNGERFMRRALDSLLAQDYENFELIISDNASSDSTADICQQYLAKDRRIHYYRNDVNRGAAENFNRVFELSKGKYFMWAAADDWREPAFISRCVDVLEADPSVVLVYPQCVLTDDDGMQHGLMPGNVDTRDWGSPLARCIVVLLGVTGNMVYGLMRADALKRTALSRKMLGSDIVLLVELSLLGTFAHIREPLFYRRRMRKGEGREERVRRWLIGFDPKKEGRRVYFPYWKTLWGFIEVANNAPLDWRRKLQLWLVFLACVPWKLRKELMLLWV